MRIVLIDDEMPMLDALQKILGKLQGVYVVGKATTGLSGLKLICSMQPDLAFVDIQMPSMDGLELAKQIKERGIDTKIVILTAYQDFDYAKRGIEAGVLAYLLKHMISEESINDIIENVRVEKLQKQQMIRVPKNGIISMFVRGDNTQLKLEDNSIAGNESYYMVLIQRVQPLWPTAETDQAFGGLDQDLIIRCASESDLHVVHCMNYKNDIVVVLFSEPDKDNAQVRSSVYSFILKHKRIYNERICYIMLNKEMRLYKLHEAAEIGEKWLEIQNWKEKEKVIFVNGPPDPASKLNVGSIISAVIEENEELACKNLEQIHNSVKTGRFTTKDLKAAFNSLLEICNTKSGKNYLNAYENECEIYTIDEAFEMLHDRIKFVLLKEEFDKISYKLKTAIDYIKQHYCDSDLNQQRVADYIGVSSVYLSTLFRKEMNISFLDFVTSLRMKRAKYLLLNTNMKVYEISENVGYQTGQYFGRLFRQKIGLSPAEFRESGGD